MSNGVALMLFMFIIDGETHSTKLLNRVMLSEAKGLVYGLLTSSPWVFPDIVAIGRNWHSHCKRIHCSLSRLRCRETGEVTMLLTHTVSSSWAMVMLFAAKGLSRSADRCFASLSMTGLYLPPE